MLRKKSIWNSLPAKPVDKKLLVQVIGSHASIAEVDLKALTGLSKTRMLCALDELIAEGLVAELSPRIYSLTSTS